MVVLESQMTAVEIASYVITDFGFFVVKPRLEFCCCCCLPAPGNLETRLSDVNKNPSHLLLSSTVTVIISCLLRKAHSNTLRYNLYLLQVFNINKIREEKKSFQQISTMEQGTGSRLG